MEGDPRVIQLARLFGCEPGEVMGAAGRTLVESRTERLADGLFQEAAASDDVVSADSAMAYLELRLAYLGGLVPRAAAEAVRRRFAALLEQWG